MSKVTQLLFLLFFLLWTSTSQGDALTANAQAPDVLLLVDTSGSMAWALDGGTATYDPAVPGATKKSRWSILAEVLTGGINNLYVSGVTYGSGKAGKKGKSKLQNVCIPVENDHVNITKALSSTGASGTTGLYAWPQANSGTANNDPIGFRKGDGTGWCQAGTGAGKWDQNPDGLIDSYSDRIRFGMATFDNWTSIDAGTTNGSYWWYSTSENWNSGIHSSYGGISYNFGGFLYSGNSYDEGFLDSRAKPAWGRLMGFGPPVWNTAVSSLGCTSVSTCTKLHNAMVQQSVLGAGSYVGGATPLAAMMRDAYEFMLLDTTSKGTYVPHDWRVDLRVTPALFNTIGPRTDPAFLTCRGGSVILVTDGEPTWDLYTRMSSYASLLRVGGVKTYVIGVGMPQAKWKNGSIIETKDCRTLTATDLGAGRMCERTNSTSLTFKYAESPYNVSGTTPEFIRGCCNLLETAVAGGTTKAYFPSNQAELKAQFDGVLTGIAGASISRTTPVFAGVTSNYIQGGSTLAPASMFELRTSLAFDSADQLWRGKLDRVRYACDLAATPQIQAVDPNKGDMFHENLDKQPSIFPRKFFTAVPTDVKYINGTLRPPSPGGISSDGFDNLFDNMGPKGDFGRLGGGNSTGLDVPQLLTSWKTSIDSSLSSGLNNSVDLLGVRADECITTTGTTNLEDCATRTLLWYGGADLPGGTTPSRHKGSSMCQDTECSSLGAIYHSSPIVVPPPQSFDSDDQNFGRNRSDGTQSFVDKYGNRPTMVYAQTVDGQLHGFVLNKNLWSGTDPFNISVPPVDTLNNNELWTFVPPLLLPRINDNFNLNSRLMDGQMSWANVVFSRPYGNNSGISAADTINWNYSTIIVGSGGISSAGGYYYAVDVTDPLNPRFLWQMTTAGNDDNGEPNDNLFGSYAPGAAITHIRYKDGPSGAEKVLAVAVLPGGTQSDMIPTTVRNRRKDPTTYWQGNRTPRSRIRDWGLEVPSRSLTIVELSSGRILGRMVGDMSDNPRDYDFDTDLTRTGLNPYVVVPPVNTPFDSPLTGIPVPYPNGTGAIADRIYIGDADGTMWRVELGGPRPSDWRAFIAFDPYNIGTTGNSTTMDAWISAGPSKGNKLSTVLTPPTADSAALLGQPIQTADVMSIDNFGDIVLTFSTGDQESFAIEADGMLNYMISVVDKYEPTKPTEPKFQVKVDGASGVEMGFLDGTRVTGNLNLFDGQLFFSYFVPGEINACSTGLSGICGVRYVEKDSNGSPVELLDFGGTTALDECLDLTAGWTVFGISVNQVPSCVSTPTGFSDPWLAGNYSAITQSTVGTFQLSYQTGQSGTAQNGSSTNTAKFTLPTPKAKTKVRSWVSLVE